MLSHKTSLSVRTEVIQGLFSEHNRIKLEMSAKRYLENPQMFGNDF